MPERPYRVPRSLKAAVYRNIERTGLNPADFRWQDYATVDSTGEELVHQPTESYFVVTGGMTEGWFTQWAPARHDGRSYEICRSEIDVGNNITTWLAFVKREHETPDLWAALERERQMLSDSVVDSEAGFTPAEQTLIHERLSQLKAQVEKLGAASEEQARRLELSFQQASAASTTLTRGQWKTLFVGTMFEAILNLGLDPTRAQQVFHLATTYIWPIVARIRGLLA